MRASKWVCAGMASGAIVLITSKLYYNYYAHEKLDLSTAKSINVTYKDKSLSVEEGLKKLVGKDGVISWSYSDIDNSFGDHLADVGVTIIKKDKNNKSHTTKCHFRLHYSRSMYMLEHCEVDNLSLNRNDSTKLLVTGSLD